MKVETEVKAEAEKWRIKFCDEVPVFDGAGREGMAQEESEKGVGMVGLALEMVYVVGLSGWMGVRVVAELGKVGC